MPTKNKTKSREMLFVLSNLGHRHVWAPAVVTAEERASDPDITPEENAAVHCLHTYGHTCAPHAVRDQYGKLITRTVRS